VVAAATAEASPRALSSVATIGMMPLKTAIKMIIGVPMARIRNVPAGRLALPTQSAKSAKHYRKTTRRAATFAALTGTMPLHTALLMITGAQTELTRTVPRAKCALPELNANTILIYSQR